MPNPGPVQLDLNLALFCELRRLGITQVTLTKDACDRLNEQMKGLYKPSAEELSPEELREIDCGWMGTLGGIRFYREIASEARNGQSESNAAA